MSWQKDLIELMITILFVRLGEAIAMCKYANRFIFCWIFVLCSQFILVLSLLGSFVRYLGVEGWISYFFTTGYAIMYWVGFHWVGPMPISDGRWICGALMLIGSSIVALMQRDNKLNLLFNSIFMVLHIIGSLSSFYNLGTAIT